ncbi:MAG: aldehyde dehydrogenase [Evtepia sp.]
MEQKITAQRNFFRRGQTRELAFRDTMLKRMEQGMRKHEAALLEALAVDLGKSAFEAYTTELAPVFSELARMRKNLKRWAAPTKKKSARAVLPARSYVQAEPYGVVLILSPWNYPLQLALIPLLSALAAGNCVILKPSEQAPHVSHAIADLLAEEFPEEYVCVMEGDVSIAARLLAQEFDYIFYTGSATVGKTVMTAAAQHLTPVTLELGGKSPCILAEDADLDLAAKRIVWGKLLNAGQTCVAPDHVWLRVEQRLPFVDYVEKWLNCFLGETALENPDFARMVNEKQFKRVVSLIEPEKVVLGGGTDIETLRIEPTVLWHVRERDAVMQEEIFGPVLPILTYHNLDALIAHLQTKEKPLALYLFTKSKKTERKVMNTLSFGGGCVNDTMVHVIADLPFGGVGTSGMGAYHGKSGFDTFSHYKSLVYKGKFEVPLRYPPFDVRKIPLVKTFMG